MTGEWAIQDIFTGISDKVIISVLSKDDPYIQAALCTTAKLNLEWRFHFPSSWPQPLVFFLPWPPLSPSRLSPFGHTQGSTSLTGSVMFLQCDAVSMSTSDQSAQDHHHPRGDGEECPIREESFAPLRMSEGSSTTTKRTVSFTEDGSFLHTACSMGIQRPI